jgi:hypothetical protein
VAPLDPKDYAGKPRDTVIENRLAAELRAQEPEAVFAFIWELLGSDVVLALALAPRVLRKQSYFEQILRRGLEVADASSIQLWIRTCLPRLGADKMLSIFRDVATRNPRAGETAMYYMRILLLKEKPALRNSLEALADQIGGLAKDPRRGPP